jgi:hypothetical protein
MLRVDQITGDCAQQLKFPASAANANCALRTLRRMLHKAEEWNVIAHAAKIKMMKEQLCPTLLDPASPANSAEVSTTPLGRRDLFRLDNLDLRVLEKGIGYSVGYKGG